MNVGVLSPLRSGDKAEIEIVGPPVSIVNKSDSKSSLAVVVPTASVART